MGAVLGAGLGYLNGGARGALIGAGVGSVAGGAAGYAVAHNNLAHSHTQADLQKAIQEANLDADTYDHSAAASMQIASDLRNQMAQLRQQYNSHTISAAQYQASVATYHDSAETIQKQIARMKTTADGLQADSANYHSSDLGQAATRIRMASQREQASLQSIQEQLSAVPTT